MKLDDMTEPEKTALGTLARLVVALDGEYSLSESTQLQAAAAELGEEEFWRVVRDAGRQHHSEEIVTTQAAAVERQEARETIYGVLFNIAAAGSIVNREGHLLDQLATAWRLETEIRGAEDG